MARSNGVRSIGTMPAGGLSVPQLRGGLQAFQAQHAADVTRQRQLEGREHRILGEVSVTGAGEVVFPVSFPVWFWERPSVSFGAELATNEKLVAGKYPTVSVVVQKWRTVRRDLHDFYTGADLLIVTTGHDDRQRSIVHWQAEGRALVNPAIPS